MFRSYSQDARLSDLKNDGCSFMQFLSIVDVRVAEVFFRSMANQSFNAVPVGNVFAHCLGCFAFR